jgi:succinyl-CoA synthetase beta subunit
MASTEGGMDIEEVADKTPEKIMQVVVDPIVGLQPYQARYLAFGLGLEKNQIREFGKLIVGMAKMFEECDLALLEVNPLVVTGTGSLICQRRLPSAETGRHARRQSGRRHGKRRRRTRP